MPGELGALGGVDHIKEDCRDARGVSLMETLAQDLRYGWRTLLKSPGFAVAALLTLALAIGANTAIFSVVYGILLRPLPFADASRLIVVRETTPRVGDVSVSYPNFQDWRAQSRAFSEMAARELRYFWWLVLLVALAIWLIWGIGRKPKL